MKTPIFIGRVNLMNFILEFERQLQRFTVKEIQNRFEDSVLKILVKDLEKTF